MSDLPCEILEQIFFRLPARLLLRFKIVCKQWRSLISDPNFAKEHANRSDLQPEVFTRLISREFSSRNCMILRSIDCETLDSTKFELEFKSPIIPRISGCCNGLWLVDRFDSDRRVHDAPILWNPLFSKTYKYLPRFSLDSSYKKWFIGFGYAPYIDDYKVVRVNWNLLKRNCCHSELEVEVYSLKRDSWVSIPGIPRSSRTYNRSLAGKEGTRVRGSIYWLIFDCSQNMALVAFDLITEKFKLLETPSSDDDHENGKSSLADLVQVGGCIGVYRSGSNCEDIVIWIWNEDESEKGNWTKLLKIPSKRPGFTSVLSFLGKSQVLLKYLWTEKFVIYDSASMMFRDIPWRSLSLRIHTAVETLISPLSF